MRNPLFSLRLPENLLNRIPPVLKGGENKPAFIREALARELARREAILAERGETSVETFT